MKRTLPIVFCLAVAAAPAMAQTSTAKPAAATTPSPATTPPGAPAAAVEAESEVKPTGTSPAATGVAAPAQGYTYNAEGRRDPFVPLLRGAGKQTLAPTATVRAAGLAGLSAADVTLRGVLMSQGSYVAMLHGNDEKTYIVRTGDRLADGTIRAITSEMLVIDQQVNDPLSKQKEREVRKMLRHPDGTN
jgi:Tfp pilus assembly protein PilP